MASSNSRPHNYRPDIDGLRALSVIAVILFHAQLGATGGFVGVDIFFVISGYLITSLILRDFENQRFSLAHFWERRIRRIMPASVVVLATTLFAGCFILLPQDLEHLVKSAIAQTLFLANIFFMRDVGYFDGPADMMPLLHTWSLAVEEQFYMLFPLALLLLQRLARQKIARILFLAALVSFASSVMATTWYPIANFYLLPTRAWELLIGGMLAAKSPNFLSDKKYSLIFGLLGLLLMVLPMLLYSRVTPFPGLAALPPCLGAALFIATGEKHPTKLGRFFTFKPLVFVGLISYSLYLWHWPVFAFSRYLFGIQLSTGQTIWAIALSLVFATLSWRCVELPFRSKGYLKTRASVFSMGLVTTLVLLSTAVGIWKFGGEFLYADGNSQKMLDDVTYVGAEYRAVNRPQGSNFEFHRIGTDDSSTSPDFLLWGDSHALALAHSIDNQSKEFGLTGIIAASPAVIPVPGVIIPHNYDVNEQLAQMNEDVLALIHRQEISKVILVARWTLYVEGFSPSELTGHPNRTKYKMLISNNSNSLASPEMAAATLEMHLKLVADQLVETGVQRIWIIKQVPEQHDLDLARTWLLSRRLPFIVSPSGNPTTYTEHQTRQARVNAALDHIAQEIPQVRLLDPAEFCFDTNGVSCLYKNGFSCYRDNDHLSKNGVDLLLQPLIQRLLLEIKELP